MKEWPILRTFDQQHLRKVAMPIGGIGTGTISLGGRGNLQDWEIMNSPAKGYTPHLMDLLFYVAPFFSIYTKDGNGNKRTKVLEGAIDPSENNSSEGCRTPNHGLPRFRECFFDTAYPFGTVSMMDKNMPVDVQMKAFNPLIPGDEDKSGIPTAIITYVVHNKTDKPIDVSVCGTMNNIVGEDPRDYKEVWTQERIYKGSKWPVNVYQESDTHKGIIMEDSEIDPKSPSWGTFAFAAKADGDVTYRTAWANQNWNGSVTHFWDDFSEDGQLTADVEPAESPYSRIASVAVKKVIPANEKREFQFILGWHFPNRPSWLYKSAFIDKKSKENKKPVIVGNYYTEQYKDAWEVITRTASELSSLESGTLLFVESIVDSDYPQEIKEAALFNASTLRTQTCFRLKNGLFMAWEGSHDREGSCWGSCTHVWNYEQTTAFLFGNLAKSMRHIEYKIATQKETGHMSFRVKLPLNQVNRGDRFEAAADGQMGCIMKFYREYMLSGDKRFLRRYWPLVRKSLEFCWLEGSWDADMDGVMEGCQHNTMDIEYYGPNPEIQTWYLGALKAAYFMAVDCGEYTFAEQCKCMFFNGSKWMDENLFNGEYYIQKVQVPNKIREGLIVGMGDKDSKEPKYQLGEGCLIDQLVGQYMAHVCGLGYLLKKENVQKTLKSIMKYNYKEDMFDHFNNLRTFALNDESAVLMASYPHGNRPTQPFTYYNEVMTGFEHQLAVHLMYEGMEDDALKVVGSIRDRYDGYKRNPFDEAECGHHYARAMAAWGGLLAYSGFHYDGRAKSMTFAEREGTFFWSNGYAWGIVVIDNRQDGYHVKIVVFHGEIKIKDVFIGENKLKKNKININM